MRGFSWCMGIVEQRVPTVRKLGGKCGNGSNWRGDKKKLKQWCDNEAALVGIREKIGVSGNRGMPKGEVVEIRKR